jgi:putative ABC transport system permease protein
MMDSILQDLRYAVRGFSRARSLALVAILTLALGIGAATTMFSVVYAALLRPLPFAEPDRIVMLFVTRTTPREGRVRVRWSVPAASTLAASVSSYEKVATVTGASIALSGGDGGPEQIDGELVSADYFGVMRVATARRPRRQRGRARRALARGGWIAGRDVFAHAARARRIRHRSRADLLDPSAQLSLRR